MNNTVMYKVNCMFFESLIAAAKLDFGFFVSLVLGNLFWLFAIYSIVHYFVGTRTVYSFVVLTLNFWIITNWAALAGGVLFVGGFLLLNYISKLTVLKFSEGNKFLAPRLIWINESQAWIAFIGFNLAVLLGFW